MDNIQKAILGTLVYADIFDYPLTSKELYQFLISDEVVNCSSFKQALTRIITNEKRLPRTEWYWGIDTNGKYFFLKGQRQIVNIRKKRERWSRQKLKIARRVARWLKLIPTIKMVGVTGALAMNNSDLNDDIDLLIVTGKNRLWLTRLFTVLLVELIARRRHPGDKEVTNKICLNMFLDENHLLIPPKEQDLFSAHEVCQMKVLWEKEEIYQRFLKENQWVKRFLPNWRVEMRNAKWERQKSHFSLRCLTSHFSPLTSKVEHLAYQLQLRYMQSRKTTEITDPHRIRFHPQDCREWIMGEYQKRLKNLKIR
jgi:predicted nucleotidyltransferase